MTEAERKAQDEYLRFVHDEQYAAALQDEFEIHWAESGMDREPDRDKDDEMFTWWMRMTQPE